MTEGRPRLVAQKPIDALGGETLLPAPDASLRSAGPAHDLDHADALGREQNDFGSPDVLLRRVAVGRDRLEAATVGGAERDQDAGAHGPDSHTARPIGIPSRTRTSGSIH